MMVGQCNLVVVAGSVDIHSGVHSSDIAWNEGA